MCRKLCSNIDNDGILKGIRGFFRGIGPALVTVPLFWGIYWGTYDYLKSELEQHLPNNPHIKHTLSAIGAGMVGDIITNPFWVVRTRIQAYALHKTIESNTDRSKIQPKINTLALIKKMFTEEGAKVFYKGTISIIR